MGLEKCRNDTKKVMHASWKCSVGLVACFQTCKNNDREAVTHKRKIMKEKKERKREDKQTAVIDLTGEKGTARLTEEKRRDFGDDETD
jgi:hypothetical protein